MLFAFCFLDGASLETRLLRFVHLALVSHDACAVRPLKMLATFHPRPRRAAQYDCDIQGLRVWPGSMGRQLILQSGGVLMRALHWQEVSARPSALFGCLTDLNRLGTWDCNSFLVVAIQNGFRLLVHSAVAFFGVLQAAFSLLQPTANGPGQERRQNTLCAIQNSNSNLQIRSPNAHLVAHDVFIGSGSHAVLSKPPRLICAVASVRRNAIQPQRAPSLAILAARSSWCVLQAAAFWIS